MDVLLSEMVLRLARVEECHWSTVFWFSFRLLDTTTGVSTTSSKNTVLWDARRLLHKRRILSNSRHCVTVRGQGFHQLVQLSLDTSSATNFLELRALSRFMLSTNGILGISAVLVTFMLTEVWRLIATGTSTTRSTYWLWGSFDIGCAV